MPDVTSDSNFTRISTLKELKKFNRSKRLEANVAAAKASKRDLDDTPVSAEKGFGEHNPYWSSSLFNPVYLKTNLRNAYKDLWETDIAFEHFHNDFHNFVLEKRIEKAGTWSESDTIANWIVKVMEMLGWHDKCEGSQLPYMTELSLSLDEDGKPRTYRFDLAYVDEPGFKADIKGAGKAVERLHEARHETTGVQMVVEAKYWDRLEQCRQRLKEDKKRADRDPGDGARSLSPDDQIIKYLDVLQRPFGILTDGKRWRLYHRDESKGDLRRHFEFNLGALADLVRGGVSDPGRRKEFLENAKYFFFFFRKQAHVQTTARKPFVYEVMDYSKTYSSKVGELLKDRFIYAMGHLCNGFKRSLETKGKSSDLDLIRSVAESHIFNILFIRSCEARRVLPFPVPDYLKVSLTEVIECLDHMRFDGEKGFESFSRPLRLQFGESFVAGGFEIYDRLIALYKIVNNGDVGFGIPGFQESLFSDGEWKFAQTFKVDNASMLLALFALNFTESEVATRKYQQIPYSSFTARQLGEIYESFLEFRLEEASTDMVFVGKQWQSANLSSKKVKSLNLKEEQIARKDQLFFSPGKDRKLTGAFYTPDYVVQYIIEKTLNPLCSRLNSKKIAELKICDPAIGSGHFLSAALQYLTKRYRDAWSQETLDDIEETFEESARRILDACIHGVDINARAVKLAKMSLWLSTAVMNRKLERLDDQLIVGDSLVDDAKLYEPVIDWAKVFPKVFSQGGFDAIVGNPPYVRIQSMNPELSSFFSRQYVAATSNYDLYCLFVEKSLRLLSPRGLLGMIVPHRFFKSEYGEGLRKVLSSEFHVTGIVDFDGFMVFNDANINTALIFGGRAPSVDIDVLRIAKHDLEEREVKKILFNEGKSRAQSYVQLGPVPSDRLSESPWVFIWPHETKLWKKLDAVESRLKDVTEKIFQGLKTGADPVFIGDWIADGRRELILRIGSDKEQISLERDLLHPLVKGGGMKRYGVTEASKYIIFPYENGKLIPASTLKKAFPKTWKHLEAHRELLEKRDRGDMKGPEWYGYSRNQAINVIAQPKILTPDYYSCASFSLDHEGHVMFCGGGAGGYGIVPKEGLDSAYLLGLLNSRLIDWYLQKISMRAYQTAFMYTKKYISELPIVVPRSAEEKRSAKRICELVGKIKSVTGSERKGKQVQKLQESLDSIVLDLYGIEPADIRDIDLNPSELPVPADEAEGAA